MRFLMCGIILALSGNSWAMSAAEFQKHISEFYNKSNKDNMQEQVTGFYHPDIEFVDPVIRLQGIDKMLSYYAHLYENVKEIRFDIPSVVGQGNTFVALWKMTLSHAKLKGGDPIELEGNSYIVLKNGKAIYHRDYFDLGEMLYENIPLIGGIVRYIKGRAAKY